MTILSKSIFTDNNLQTLGENLHWVRAEKGLSILQASQRLNCEGIIIDELERGKSNLDCELLQKIIQLYKIKITINIGDYND